MTTTRTSPVAAERDSILAAYVPRLLEEHQRSRSDERLLLASGTLVSADISGFTALSERLAAFGHEGAEELTDLLNRCFTAMIDACERRSGDVIKFGGDALLVFFTGDEHAIDAAIAMSEMHEVVSRSWSTESVKSVSLGISQGAHSGTIGFSLADAGYLELIVGGPAVSTTVRCEGEAARGEILVSEQTAALLPGEWLGSATHSGARRLLRKRVLVAADRARPEPSPRGLEGLDRYLAPDLADQLTAGVPGEHRQVVVAFVNLMGSDDLFAERGADAVHRAAQTFVENVRSVLDRHPVHLLASDVYVNGSKLILTAGVPRSTDADEDHMLLALHDLFGLPSPLPIRAGVNRGHVFVGDLGGPTRRTFTVMGDAVNLAARLMQRAEAGQIITSTSVVARASTGFALDRLAPFYVKGKTEPIRAAVLGAPQEVTTDEHLGYIEFVGRHEELHRFDQMVSAAASGTGSVVHVGGEVGIGKSRLVREVFQRHPEFRVHRMRGGQYARNTPFLAVRLLLRSLLALDGDDPADLGEQLVTWTAERAPHLVAWLPLAAIAVGAEVGMTSSVERLAEEFRRDRLLMVTADLIDAALAGPDAIVADDIDLVDNGSVDVLRNLARRATGQRLVIVSTGPSELAPLVPDVARVDLGELEHDDAVRVATAAATKAGLTPDDIGADHLEALTARANGNPLFVLELIAATRDGSIETVPESIESLITTRIDQLPPSDRTLLREIAVGGLNVDAALISSAFDRPELDAADRWAAFESFLVEESPGRFRFRQMIYRDVAYEGLAYRRRRELHLALGTTLEHQRSDRVSAITPLLSDHFDRAREHERAWRYSVIAGDSARRSYANNEAVTLFERALRNADRSESADTATMCRVAEGLGDVHFLMGHHEAALESYRRSRSWSAGPHDRARLLRKIGGVRLREGRLSDSLTWFTRAQREADSIDNERTRMLESAEVALARAGALLRQGRTSLAARWAETAAERAETTGDRLTMARAFNMVEVTYRQSGREGSPVYSDLALEMYDGTGDIVGQANVLNNRGVRHHFDGQWQTAIAEYERARRLREQAGDVVGEATVANNIGELLSLQGRYDEALELFAHAITSWSSVGYSVGVGYAMANSAVTMARGGDPIAAADLLEAGADVLRRLGASQLVAEADIRRIEIDLIAGDIDSALVRARDAHERLCGGADTGNPLLVQLLPLLGIAHVRASHFDDGEVVLGEALTRAEAAGDLYVQAVTRSALAIVDRDNSGTTAHRQAAARLFKTLDTIRTPPIVGPFVE